MFNSNKLSYVTKFLFLIFCFSSVSIAVQNFNDDNFYTIRTIAGASLYVSDDSCGRDSIVKLRPLNHAGQDNKDVFRILREGDHYRIINRANNHGLYFCNNNKHFEEFGYKNVESGIHSVGDRGVFVIGLSGLQNQNSYRILGYTVNYVPLYLRVVVDRHGTQHIKASVNGTGNDSVFIINVHQ